MTLSPNKASPAAKSEGLRSQETNHLFQSPVSKRTLFLRGFKRFFNSTVELRQEVSSHSGAEGQNRIAPMEPQAPGPGMKTASSVGSCGKKDCNSQVSFGSETNLRGWIRPKTPPHYVPPPTPTDLAMSRSVISPPFEPTATLWESVGCHSIAVTRRSNTPNEWLTRSGRMLQVGIEGRQY